MMGTSSFFLSLVLIQVTALNDKGIKCMVFLVLKLWEDQKNVRFLFSDSIIMSLKNRVREAGTHRAIE